MPTPMTPPDRRSPVRRLPLLALLGIVACSRGAPPADVGFVAKWTATHYALARAERLSPPVAARTSAYAAIALYEGWAAFSDSLRSLGGQLNGFDSLPRPVRGEDYDAALVAMEAQTLVLRELYREGFASTGVAVTLLRDSLLGVRERSGVPAAVRERSLAYGATLARAILAWAAEDGFAKRSLAYQAKTGPEQWFATATEAQYRSSNLSAARDFVSFDNPTAGARPGETSERALTVNRPKRPGNTTAPGINPLNALEPGWGSLRPFALDSAGVCPAPPAVPWSTEKNSPMYAQAKAVMEATASLDAERRAIAYFWADNPGESGTPAGHWLGIMSALATEKGLTPERTVEMYALTAIAMADAFIGCWKSKYEINLLRPVTYIQRHIDPRWQTPLNTPPFPEYPSGHSVQSAAAAEVLTALLGEVPFVDSTHVALGHAPRSFPSFRAAAREAQISRLYGGIHYPMAIENGAVQGRCIGEAVLRRVHTRQGE
ncbi:MAG: vanadium-dependent haloperoxidase [Gemmatimonadales bacterium]